MTPSTAKIAPRRMLHMLCLACALGNDPATQRSLGPQSSYWHAKWEGTIGILFNRYFSIWPILPLHDDCPRTASPPSGAPRISILSHVNNWGHIADLSALPRCAVRSALCRQSKFSVRLLPGMLTLTWDNTGQRLAFVRNVSFVSHCGQKGYKFGRGWQLNTAF